MSSSIVQLVTGGATLFKVGLDQFYQGISLSHQRGVAEMVPVHRIQFTLSTSNLASSLSLGLLMYFSEGWLVMVFIELLCQNRTLCCDKIGAISSECIYLPVS